MVFSVFCLMSLVVSGSGSGVDFAGIYDGVQQCVHMAGAAVDCIFELAMVL